MPERFGPYQTRAKAQEVKGVRGGQVRTVPGGWEVYIPTPNIQATRAGKERAAGLSALRGALHTQSKARTAAVEELKGLTGRARREGVRLAFDHGFTAIQIADLLGVSRERIYQILGPGDSDAHA